MGSQTAGAAHFLADVDLQPSDPYARESETFPRLSDDQVARVSAFGQVEELAAGTVLFEPENRGVDFFLVIQGWIEIYEPGPDGPVVMTVHGEHQFTGELDLFNHRAILVGGRMGVDGRVVRLSRARFRRLLSAEPDVADVVMRAYILRRAGFITHGQAAVTIVGSRRSADSVRLQRFLTRNGHPFLTVDPDADEEPESADTTLTAVLGAGRRAEPVVLCGGDRFLECPSNRELAECLGISEPLDPSTVADVVVVGAGPAGMATAVYAASEGLETLVIEGEAPGGQAGTSSRIENYLGFPTGVSGQALADRAQIQAQKFGARIVVPQHAARLRRDTDEGTGYVIELDGGAVVRTRTVVIATGARYRRLDHLANFPRFEGAGIHYAATAVEAGLCEKEEVAVVGGGNSAGQAAAFLSRHASHVHVLVRGESLAASMSDYLVSRIDAAAGRISLHTSTEITGLDGDTHLRSVTWTDRRRQTSETRPIANMFLMLGAVPNTEWLGGVVALDPKGFVRTGMAAEASRRADEAASRLAPAADLMATSLPGVFAVGDVREGSVKRVASAVGEGSVVVSSVHQALNAG